MYRSAQPIEALETRRLLSVASISDVSLYNADTNHPISGYSPLVGGATINLAALPTRHVTIAATADSAVGSLLFGYDGNLAFHTENYAPYLIVGDTNGQPIAWTPTVGSHTLVITPYEKMDHGGAAGSAVTLSFKVIDTPVTSPPAGGIIHTVDPSGAGGASKTVSAALQAAKPGDVVLIRPGTYHESFTMPRSGTAGSPITIMAAAPGTVTIDGAGFGHIMDGTYVSYINVENITFDHCANPLETAAVRVGGHWNLTDVTVQNTQSQGMEVYGTGTTLLRVIAQYNGQEGLGGTNCSSILVKDCITRYNNPGLASPSWAGMPGTSKVNGLWYVNADYEAGAGKWSGTSNVTLDGVQSYSNHGTGIWFDGPNANVTIKNCSVHDAIPIKAFYEGVGISIELNNTGPVTIQNNNCYNDPGGTIVVASSRHVKVTGNIFGGSYIALNDWPRGSDFTMQDVTFSGNQMNNTFIWTGGTNWLAHSGATKQIIFDTDTYKGMTGPMFRWGTGVYQKIADVRSGLGFELRGSQV